MFGVGLKADLNRCIPFKVISVSFGESKQSCWAIAGWVRVEDL